MSNMAITDWLTFTPAGVVRNAKAYIDLPAFSYSAQGTAGEASIIVAQFNFSASRDFYLVTRPTKPSGVNYGLCIRWRVGETVYRYKLWEDASFILNNETPLYNRQRIRANFVLEIWNFAGSASSNAAAIRMITSVRTAPTDFRSITDYALAVGAEFTDLGSINPTLPAGATNRWTNFATSAGLTDVISGAQLVEYGPDIAQVEYTAADSTWLRGRAKFQTDSNLLYARLLGQSFDDYTIYAVMNIAQLSVALTRYALNAGTSKSNAGYFSYKLGSTDKARLSGDNTFFDLTFPDTNPHILRLTRSGVDMSGRLDTGTTGTALDSGNVFTSPYLTVGGLDGQTPSIECNIAEILIYGSSAFASGDANDLAVLSYLRWYHFGEIPLPASFNAGSAWLDNAPL
jgi:hypothetical protein